MATQCAPKTRQELAADIGISVSTLSRRLKRLGISLPARRLLTPKEVEKVYRILLGKE